MANPVVSIRKFTLPAETESLINFGYIAADQTGFSLKINVYNNYDSAASVSDAKNFKVCVYDDQSKNILTDPVKDKWVQVRQIAYNGISLNNEYVSIGGETKYQLPYNSGILAGSDGERGSYTTLEFRIVTPHRLDISKKWNPYICFEYEV